MLEPKATALATRCLWSLQEAAPEIEGLLLTSTSGLTLTSTFDGGDSTQRLAAISTALFLLSEHTAHAWDNGDTVEVMLTLNTDKHEANRVCLLPVGDEAVLMAVHHSNSRAALIQADLTRAADYLTQVINGEDTLAIPRWQSY